jgi:hypothetical protein
MAADRVLDVRPDQRALRERLARPELELVAAGATDRGPRERRRTGEDVGSCFVRPEEKASEVLRGVGTWRGGPGECGTGGGEDGEREGGGAEVSHGKSLFGTAKVAGVPLTGDAPGRTAVPDRYESSM